MQAESSPSYGCTTGTNRIKSLDSKHLLVKTQNHFMTKKRREFANWPFNEIVKGFDEQRSAFIGETIFPCSPSMLRISGTTRLLRSWDLSSYQNIHSSLAPLRILNPIWPCGVLDCGSHWEIMVGWWWTTRVRCWWDPPLNTEDVKCYLERHQQKDKRAGSLLSNPKAAGTLQQLHKYVADVSCPAAHHRHH